MSYFNYVNRFSILSKRLTFKNWIDHVFMTRSTFAEVAVMELVPKQTKKTNKKPTYVSYLDDSI